MGKISHTDNPEPRRSVPVEQAPGIRILPPDSPEPLRRADATRRRTLPRARPRPAAPGMLPALFDQGPQPTPPDGVPPPLPNPTPAPSQPPQPLPMPPQPTS